MNIEPIKLLSGSHADTAQTGHGCFMNVIAYLNGEPQITDQSPCVCVYVRPLAIRLNDCGTGEQRQRLLPFVMRAMGSATEDKAVMASRRARLREYGEECHQIVLAWKAEMKTKDPKGYAYANANAYADANAYAYANAYVNANAYADAYADADAYANAHAHACAARLKASLFDAGMRYLDDVLPPAEPVCGVVAERCETLKQLQGVA